MGGVRPPAPLPSVLQLNWSTSCGSRPLLLSCACLLLKRACQGEQAGLTLRAAHSRAERAGKCPRAQGCGRVDCNHVSVAVPLASWCAAGACRHRVFHAACLHVLVCLPGQRLGPSANPAPHKTAHATPTARVLHNGAAPHKAFRARWWHALARPPHLQVHSIRKALQHRLRVRCCLAQPLACGSLYLNSHIRAAGSCFSGFAGLRRGLGNKAGDEGPDGVGDRRCGMRKYKAKINLYPV